MYHRIVSPDYGFLLLNRLTPQDFQGFISPSQSLMRADNFLIYRDDLTGKSLSQISIF